MTVPYKTTSRRRVEYALVFLMGWVGFLGAHIALSLFLAPLFDGKPPLLLLVIASAVLSAALVFLLAWPSPTVHAPQVADNLVKIMAASGFSWQARVNLAIRCVQPLGDEYVRKIQAAMGYIYLAPYVQPDDYERQITQVILALAEELRK